MFSSSLESMVAFTPTLFKCLKLHVYTLLNKKKTKKKKLTDVLAIESSVRCCK